MKDSQGYKLNPLHTPNESDALFTMPYPHSMSDPSSSSGLHTGSDNAQSLDARSKGTSGGYSSSGVSDIDRLAHRRQVLHPCITLGSTGLMSSVTRLQMLRGQVRTLAALTRRAWMHAARALWACRRRRKQALSSGSSGNASMQRLLSSLHYSWLSTNICCTSALNADFLADLQEQGQAGAQHWRQQQRRQHAEPINKLVQNS